MLSIKKCPIPVNTMLDRYSVDGAYVDCYLTEVSVQVSLSDYLFAFYTTPLFKVERFVLLWAASKPSTDEQARQLSRGDIEVFAAWKVESRKINEILLCDFRGRTRSWLMTTSVDTADGAQTRLYFGSAVVPVRNLKTGKQTIGLVFQALLGFHKIYSILLLYSAKFAINRKTLRTS
jgi:hypothetical protein